MGQGFTQTVLCAPKDIVKGVYKGVKNVRKGAALILVPEPTTLTDVTGVGLATVGILQGAFGIKDIVVGIQKATGDD